MSLGNKFKTHCKNGHEFTLGNTRVRKQGEYRLRQCKTCHRIRAKRRYWADPQYRLQTIRRASSRNRLDAQKLVKSAWKNKAKLIRFGLTQDQFDFMRAAQNNQCFLCGKEKVLCLDHSHSSGQLRKLLCHNCNLGLGNFYDNPGVLKKAVEYVEMFL